MWPIVTDRVAWSVGLSVGLSDTLVSPVKTAAPIEMPFWVEDLGGLREPRIKWGSRSPMERGNFQAKGRPIVNYRDTLRSPVQKRLNRSRCLWVVGWNGQ